MEKKQIPEGYICGVFLSECKNRFRCIVEIEGIATLCYIASSCRLDNFIDLSGREVLLKPTSGKNAIAKYTVWAVKYKKGYVLLNSSLANRAVDNSIRSRSFSFVGKRTDRQKEHTVEGYKSDFYLPSRRAIIEVKSVITLKKTACLGTIHSDRFLQQLEKIEELLQNGYEVHLFIVSLNPYVQAIEFPKENFLASAIAKCVSKGLQLSAFTCHIAEDGDVYIRRRISIY